VFSTLQPSDLSILRSRGPLLIVRAAPHHLHTPRLASNRSWFPCNLMVSHENCLVFRQSLRCSVEGGPGDGLICRTLPHCRSPRRSGLGFEPCVLEYKGFSPGRACFAGRFSHRLPCCTPLLGVPALQGLTGSTLQRISPPLPSRSCRTARVVPEPQGFDQSSCGASILGFRELSSGRLRCRIRLALGLFSLLPKTFANERFGLSGHW